MKSIDKAMESLGKTRMEILHEYLNEEYPDAEIIGEYGGKEIVFYPHPDRSLVVLSVIYHDCPGGSMLTIDVVDDF